jgi:hypothetical protein
MKKVELGISESELRKQVIASVVERVYDALFDEDSDFTQDVQREIGKRTSAEIEKKVDKLVLPMVKTKLDGLIIPETNRYGEPKGKSMTFIEFATQKAEQYMTEEVNYEGKPRGSDSYSWRGTQTRIAHMVHQHLHYTIETAMKQSLKEANSRIVEGIEKTVKLKLTEIAEKLKVDVKVG